MKIFEQMKESDKEELFKQIHEFATMCLFCKFSADCRMGNNILFCDVKAKLGSEV